jgi:hypothetical protein
MQGSAGMDLRTFIERCRPAHGDELTSEFGRWRYVSSRLDGVIPPSLQNLQTDFHLFFDLWPSLSSWGWGYKEKK